MFNILVMFDAILMFQTAFIFHTVLMLQTVLMRRAKLNHLFFHKQATPHILLTTRLTNFYSLKIQTLFILNKHL
ncbi:hypothetical protein CWN88_09105 [Vibrio splendidus]|nr:hypothetical protein CWN82_16235 [Vibrio splendidus]PTP03073.1 hypothetical protein CWN88_09105 [Vibrio splendidus]PTQ07633.1 hypothetical protein CWO28_08330 [Vibrio splendidus]